MSSKTAATVAENRTIFDNRPISESKLEVSKSSEYALYVVKRVAVDTDEVHIFPLGEDAQTDEQVHTILMQLTEDPDVSVSELSFQKGVDGRLIISVQAVSCVEEFSPGHEAANYLQSRI